MAKNVELMGAVFPDCPAVMLPTHEGPLARFTDVSDSQAVAADVAQGKAFYLADGTKTTGTNQGGGGGGGGGGTIKPNARLVLIDYDGSIVDSYTQSEVDALSALPANPDHSGDEIPLTSQGWNWTLQEIREQLAAMPEQTVYVGNTVIPTDGKTHIKIFIDPNSPESRRTMNVRFTQSVARGVAVNWGDATPEETYTGTSAANHSHTYTGTGWFDVTLEVMSGTVKFEGASSASIIGAIMNLSSYVRGMVKEIHLGSGLATDAISSYMLQKNYRLEKISIPQGPTSIGSYQTELYGLKALVLPNTITSIKAAAFQNSRLEMISIPNGVTTIESYAFGGSQEVGEITLPKGVTTLGTQVFDNCNALEKVSFPTGITEIPGMLLRYCHLLTNLTIPENISNIGANVCTACYSVGEVHVKPTVPPTITANSFSSFASNAKFFVPYSEDHSILAAYQAADYWSTYASRMVEEAE